MIKVTKYFFYIILYPLSLILFSCTSPTQSSPERPQVIVDHDITEDTVWEGGKDYVVEKEITIHKNVLLYIESNVNVIFKNDSPDNNKIIVEGIIYAIGVDSSIIVFKASDQVINKPWGLELNNSSDCCMFAFCKFDGLMYGINSYNSSLEVSKCFFNKCYTGISLYNGDTIIVDDSDFINNNYGIKSDFSPASNDSIYISGNFFNANAGIAIEIKNNSKAVIKKNLFKNCRIGISNLRSGGWSGESRIRYNDFVSCSLACDFLYAAARLTNNNFLNGNVGVYTLLSDIYIRYNNFLEHEQYKIKYYSSSQLELNAIKNWWGSNSEEVIETYIWDGENNLIDNWIGIVDYQPFLYSENESAGLNIN